MRPLPLAALALLVLLVPASARAVTVGHVRVALDQNATFPDYPHTAARNGYVLLQPYQTGQLRALKAANPNVKVLMYQNVAAASTVTGPALDSGVGYDEANANGWLLHDSTTGQPFSFNGYPHLYGANVGSPGYQAAWARNVLARLQSGGWDGVFMDDVDATMKYSYPSPQNVQEYPTDAAYAAATGSFLASVGPQLKAAGKLVVANIGAWVEYPDTVRPWLADVSGAMDEKFIKWGATAGQGVRELAQWEIQESELKDTEAAGDFFLGVVDSDANDEGAATYGYASALLASNGNSFVSLVHDNATETWFPEYDLVLGSPAGAAVTGASGLRRRTFAQGLVLVNPTDAPITASFGGVYTGSGLTAARSATLAPHTGLVMTKGPKAITAPQNFPLYTPPAPAREALRGTRAVPLVRRTRHTLTVQAEALRLPRGSRMFTDPTAQGGRAVDVARRGTLTRRIRFARTKVVRVRARAQRCHGGARVVVRVNHRVVLSRVITARRWTVLAVRLRRRTAMRIVSAAFTNAHRTRRCARSLRLDALGFRDR